MRIYLALGVLSTGGCLAVNPYVVDVAPIIASFAATPSPFVPGKQTAITWNWSFANNPDEAPTCSIDNGVGRVTNGQTTNVALTGPTTYKLTCTNAAGSNTATVTVPKTAPSILSFSGALSPFVPGAQTAITWNWSLSNSPDQFPACSIDNGIGTMTSGSTSSITLTTATTYKLTCTNAAGSNTATVTVPKTAPSILSFSGALSSFVSGVPTTITWKWSYLNSPDQAPTCSINNGIGTTTSGSSSSVTLTGPTTYTLTCTNAAGSNVATTTVPQSLSIATFTVAPSYVTSAAQTSATWSWTYSGSPDQAPSCSIQDAKNNIICSGVTGTSCTGSVALTSSTTYTLTCQNAAGTASSTSQIVATTGSGCVVTSPADSGTGSLRNIVSLCPGATILFDTGLNGQTITLQSAISVGANTTIQGPAASLLTLSGGNVTQILSVSGTNVSVSGLTFSQDSCGSNCSTSPGGAVVNSGTLTVSKSTFSSNSAGNGSGGAIYNNNGTLTIADSTFTSNTINSGWGAVLKNYGTMTVTNSTFSSNSAGNGNGGAIDNSGTLTIVDSTFASNNAGSGGAITNDTGGNLTIDSSTFVSNTTNGTGGAICNTGSTAGLTITNSTFSSNSAAAGGAIYNQNTLAVRNSTFNGNSNSLDNSNGIVFQIGNSIIDQLASGTFSSLGYNLVSSAIGATFNPAATDQVGVSPALDALGNYGGPTQTMMPSLTSPAIAAVPPANCGATTDQRGQQSPSSLNANGYCDIGAVERQASDSSYP